MTHEFLNNKFINKKPEKPFTSTPTKPIIVEKRPECLKKHIRKDGKK